MKTSLFIVDNNLFISFFLPVCEDGWSVPNSEQMEIFVRVEQQLLLWDTENNES